MMRTSGLAVLCILTLFVAACAAPEVVVDPVENLEFPEGTRVDLHGAALYYRDIGSGEPIVFLHGAGLDSRMWIGQFAAFSEQYRVIAVDLPGFGQSPTPSGPYSHAVTLAYLLDELRIQRAHVVGLSEGAEDAIDFAFRFPDSAMTLTLVSPRLGGQEWSREALATFNPIMSAAAEGDSQRAANAWLEHPLFATAMRNPFLALRIGELHLDNADSWVRGTFPQRPEPRAIERLREIDVPTLIVVGDQDVESVYEIARKIDRRAVDSRLQVLPRSGHLVNMETPEPFNRLLGEFLVERTPKEIPEN